MQIVYAENIVDKILKARRDAKKENRQIDYIELTSGEMRELLARLKMTYFEDETGCLHMIDLPAQIDNTFKLFGVNIRVKDA